MENKTIVRATPAARFYAKENKINLSEVRGSGPKGRVHKCDVIDYKLHTKIKISPLAKKIADVEGVNLNVIKGTGPKGRIMKRDILALINGHQPEVVAEKTTEVSAVETAVVAKPKRETEVVPMTAMRKVIAKRMTESYLKAPTFIVNVDVDMTNLLDLRKKVQDSIIAETGMKASVTDFIAFAVVKALMKHPYINSSLSDDEKEIYLHKYVNLAIAVGTETGLLVPVVEDADKMTLKELVAANKKMITKAVEGKLRPEEMSGSTFSITNLGMYGVDSFIPIINQPNSAILAISATQEKPVVVDKEVVVRPIMTLTLTSDHRVIDGLEGAKFMQTLKNGIENPVTLLI